MSKIQILNLLALLANLAIVGFTVFSVLACFIKRFNEKMEIKGKVIFVFFTTDSNILVAISSLIMLCFNINNIVNNINYFPRFVLVFKYVATIAVMVTMMTVLLFLGPTQGYKKMFESINIFMHLITPLLAIISFSFFELNSLVFTDTFYVIIPVIIYAIIYIIMVLVKKKWEDFYGFTMKNLTVLFMVMFPVVTYGFGILIYLLHNSMIA